MRAQQGNTDEAFLIQLQEALHTQGPAVGLQS